MIAVIIIMHVLNYMIYSASGHCFSGDVRRSRDAAVQVNSLAIITIYQLLPCIIVNKKTTLSRKPLMRSLPYIHMVHSP